MSKQELYIFSKEEDLEKIMSAFCQSFGISLSEGGNQLRLENRVQIADISVFSGIMGDNYEKLIAKQINSVCGHFAQTENCNEDIKINFIYYLKQCKTFIPIKVESKTDNEQLNQNSFGAVLKVIVECLKTVDGILLAEGASKAIDADGKLILSDDGKSELEYYFPFKYTENPPLLANCTKAQLERRNQNMKYLFDKHIFVTELPLNEDDQSVNIRTKEEIAKRMLGTLAVSLYSEAMLNPEENMSSSEARKFVEEFITEYGIKDISEVLTTKELEYFNDDEAEEKTKMNFSWQYENLYLLEWAAGLDEWTEPNDICDVPKTVRILREIGSFENILKSVSVRSKKEILDKADLIYRMDWACVDSMIYGMSAPAGMIHGVVSERHKTLNWLINFMNQDWDNVDTPT